MTEEDPTQELDAIDIPKEDEVETTQPSVETIAREVIAGHWGRGHVRDKRLEDAGHDVKAVKAEVARIFRKN